jgi:hypothetical protein
VSYSQIINEFEPNPAGTDPSTTTFELKGTANTAFDLWILSLESDGYQGTVDRAGNVTGTFDTNGLATVTIPDLENPSFTIVLTDNFTGSIGDDLDVLDNGTLDTSSLGNILDAVGVSDNTADDSTLYGAVLSGSDILFNGEFEPLLVFRDGSTGDWYQTVTVDFGQPTESISVFDVNGNIVPNTNFDSDPASGPTFGITNPSNTALSIETKEIAGFSIYPNPVSGNFITIYSKSNIPMDIKVYDILGKQVINKKKIERTLSISNLNSGVYLIKAIQDRAISTKKLIVP